MNWSELSDKEKIRLIIAHVMGITTFHDSWDNINIQTFQAVWEKNYGEWHVCPRQGAPTTIFDPLHDMDQAMELTTRYDEVVIGRHVPDKWFCELWVRTIRMIGTGKTAQDAICLATLRDKIAIGD